MDIYILGERQDICGLWIINLVRKMIDNTESTCLHLIKVCICKNELNL